MRLAKKTVSVVLIGSMVLSFAGCAKRFEAVSKRDVLDAIEDVLGYDEDECLVFDDMSSESDNGAERGIICAQDDFEIFWIQYDSEKHARDAFEESEYEEFLDVLDDDDFEGRYSYRFTDDYGYILVNGESDSDDFFEGDVYGGIFWKEDMLFIALVESTNSRDTEELDEFLASLGYPHP